MEDVLIRPPLPSEYAEVATVINSELPQWQSVLDPEEMYTLRIGQETAEDLIKGEKSRHYLVAEKDSHIIGFISWSLRADAIAWISMLQVHPDYQHQGIGSRLLAAAESAAQQAGATYIGLETQKKAIWALRFYDQNGYHMLTDDDLRYEPHYRDILTRPLDDAQPYSILVKRLNNGGSAGGLIVREENGVKQILFVISYDTMFVLPKGHVDAGESPEQAAVREVLEETGFRAEIVEYLGDIVRGTRKHNGSIKDVRAIKIFRMTILGVDESIQPEESFDWFTLEEALPRMRYDEDREFLKQYQHLF